MRGLEREAVVPATVHGDRVATHWSSTLSVADGKICFIMPASTS